MAAPKGASETRSAGANLLPDLEPHTVPPEAVPEPYRSLLVHERDMTSTLEAFHGERLTLRVLSKRREAGILERQVVLVGESSGSPVEFGAIRIFLAPFEEAPRAEVIAGRRPLGAILGAFQVPYRSRPNSFLRLRADAATATALEIPVPGEVLYGRQNVLTTPSGDTIAEVVEILPPTHRDEIQRDSRPSSG